MTAVRARTLSHFLGAWESIPGISPWVLGLIRHGYSLQFRRRPPRFNGVIPSLTLPQNVPVLRQEVLSLLEKGAIEPVPPIERESGFYSRYFVVPKRGGGLRPILDLRPINRALHKRAFKMTTLKQILAQVRPGDWFASVDLKDAYFHIQIAARHRRFLRFAFEGTAYQYSVLPFGLALAPRTFSKCVDAALSPLRSSGMRILNYLDDWLILAHSREVLIGHVEILLRHLDSLGMRVNEQKSVFTPSQTTTFLGVCLNSITMRAHLSQERIRSLTLSLDRFRPGRSVPLKEFQRLLGLLAAASPVCHLGLLHMRPLQIWLKLRVPRGAWSSGLRRVTVTRSCIRTLVPWKNPALFSSGVPMGTVAHRTAVLTDASTSGWGAVCMGATASGLWTESQRTWHINRLELMAVSLALEAFRSQLERQHVLIRTDNTSVVSYINRQGGVRSRLLFEQAASLLLWADRHFLSVRAAHIPGVLNRGADMLSRNGIPHGEWRLHPGSVQMIWDRFGRAEVDLFASSENAHCQAFFSLSRSPLGRTNDALTSRWPRARLYAFPPVKILPTVLCKIREEKASVILVAPNWPNQPWFADMMELLVDSPWEIPLRRDLLSQANGTVWHPNPGLWNLHVWPLRGL
jgi:ribonuclease HI